MKKFLLKYAEVVFWLLMLIRIPYVIIPLTRGMYSSLVPTVVFVVVYFIYRKKPVDRWFNTYYVGFVSSMTLYTLITGLVVRMPFVNFVILPAVFAAIGYLVYKKVYMNKSRFQKNKEYSWFFIILAWFFTAFVPTFIFTYLIPLT